MAAQSLHEEERCGIRSRSPERRAQSPEGRRGKETARSLHEERRGIRSIRSRSPERRVYGSRSPEGRQGKETVVRSLHEEERCGIRSRSPERQARSPEGR